MYYSYIKIIFLIVFSSLILISIINFFVDPEQVYPKLFSNTNPVLKKFSKELTSSKYGIINKFGKLNERDRKKALAMFSEDADCAIFGSSHIMGISSFREDKSLTKYCKSIINLGVSGGTLEDYYAFSNMLLENKHTIGTIVFGLDPWSLKFNMDQRWNKIKNDFDKMKNRLKIKSQYPNSSYTVSLILNLINLEYLIESLDKLTSEDRLKDKDKDKDKETFIHAEKFDINKGISGSAVTLPDGSWAYSSEYINEQKLFIKIYDGFNGITYKISQLVGARWYDDNAINDLTNLVIFLQSKFNIIFVMTPYHPKVWEHQQPTVEAMKSIENKVHMLAKQLNITVIGSYNPVKIGCSKDEFFDGMHATSKCLKKLERKVLKR
jgi:hypothetical protein